ncbi:MAG: phytanoyl-CoA dioxygenase family protein [Wenzhouxiangellaceae bacterium]
MVRLPPLSAEQIAFFHRQGYLILRQAASAERVAHLRSIAEQHLQDGTPPVEYEADVHYPGSPSTREAEGGLTIRRLLQAWHRDPALQEWATHPALTQCISALLAKPSISLVLNHHNCVMTKHPRYSSATLWHQDIRYWSFQRADLVTAWLALGEETARNGCMRLIPGSHREDWDGQRFDEHMFFRPDREDNRSLMHQALRAELQPGDVLLFHSRLLHAAGRNHTDQRKLAVVFTYRASDNLPLPNTRSAQDADIPLDINGVTP